MHRHVQLLVWSGILWSILSGTDALPAAAQRGIPPAPEFRFHPGERTDSALTLMPRYADSLAYDPNGWLLNPTWRVRRPNSVRFCDFVAGRGYPPDRQLLLRRDDCSAQWELLRLNEASGRVFGGVACNQQNIDGLPHGHVNWFPVTLVGRSAHTHLFGGDGDVDFDIAIDTDVATTAANPHPAEVHAEFRWKETFSRLADLPATDTWWHAFSDSLLDSRSAAESLADGLPVIVTGLFNVDLVHHWSEVHPVYAFTVRVSSRRDAATGRQVETWAFFVRDRGDEGGCGTFIIPYEPPTGNDLDHRTVIPWVPGATRVHVGPGSRAWIHGDDGQTGTVSELRAETGQGVELSVLLPRARRDGSSAMVFGELVLEWEVGGDTVVTPQWFRGVDAGRHRDYAMKNEGEPADTLVAVALVRTRPSVRALDIPPLELRPLTRAVPVAPSPVRQWGTGGRPDPPDDPPGFCSAPGSPAQCRIRTRLEPMVGVGLRDGTLITEIRLELFGPGSPVPRAGGPVKLQTALFGGRIRVGRERRPGQLDNNWMFGIDYDAVIPFLKSRIFRPYIPFGVEISDPYGSSDIGVAGHAGVGILLATAYSVRWRTELRVPRVWTGGRDYVLVAGASIRLSALRPPGM